MCRTQPRRPFGLAELSFFKDGEAIFGYLDDTCIIALPERMHELYKAYRHALWAHSRVELNSRKTCVWNAAGEEPPGLSVLQGDVGGGRGAPATAHGLTVRGDACVRLRLAQREEPAPTNPTREGFAGCLAAAALLRRPAGQLPFSRSAARRDGRVCCLARLRRDSLPRQAPAWAMRTRRCLPSRSDPPGQDGYCRRCPC